MISKANTLFVIDCVPDSSWQRRYEWHATLGGSSAFVFNIAQFDSIKLKQFLQPQQHFASMM